MRRRWAARLVATVVAGVCAAGVVGYAAPAQAATPRMRLVSTTVAVDAAGTVPLRIGCTVRTTCRGSLLVQLAGRNGPSVDVSVPKQVVRTVTARLSAEQLAAVPPGGSVKAVVRLAEYAPARVGTRSLPVDLTRESPEPEPITDSRAFQEKNWTPTAYDTCPASLHRDHLVVGRDHKRYPTWHAATDVDPATGKTCTYGHEHGDDPRTSDLYNWVTDFLDAHQPDGSVADRGIPFGYVSEALDTYAEGHDHVTRHEDNVGHKIIVANDVKLVAASPRGYVRDAQGDPISCDYLMKIHQGSHSADALSNNAHELLYAVRCTDGTALISSTLTRFGNANQFQRSCDASITVGTSGSNLPDGFGGSRQIPDKTCVDRDVLVPSGRTSSIWSLYEVWKSVNRLRTADGTVLADFDPWFGVRNPARAAAGVGTTILDLVDTLWMVDDADGGTAHGYPWDDVPAHEGHLPKADPTSPFDGAQRDYYLGQTHVDNAGGSPVWYTDPYGENAQRDPGPGLVAQYVSGTTNTGWPVLERRTFDLDRDYGDGNGVHAPN